MGKLVTVGVNDEMRSAYLEYAMSVIVGRALPDARDGLKPVHRRILFSMHDMGITSESKNTKKSASIVGECMGKYHPHGDSSIYEALVRMAQPFSMRHTLIYGQGNFGDMDGNQAAAMRYTEAKLDKLADNMMADLEKKTVDFVPNYDGEHAEPTVLPVTFPNLLVNGSSGIAVGMATNIPTHNLGETIDATIAMIRNPEITVPELMKIMPGPDFPTGGIICGASGLRLAYETGRGLIKIRAKATIETDKQGAESIVITELPYQVNKSELLQRIGELHRNKIIQGISPSKKVEDLTDLDNGLKIIIHIQKGFSADVVLNQLYNQTQLESSFGINFLAIDDGQPKTLTLPAMLRAFIKHRRDVVRRRTKFELDKARAGFNRVAVLRVALDYIDRIIEIIRTSKDTPEATSRLMAENFILNPVMHELLARAEEYTAPFGKKLNIGDVLHFSQEQAEAILDLKLQRLTGLEREKLESQAEDFRQKMEYLLGILRSDQKLMDVIVAELEEVKAKFADKRRTQIDYTAEDFTIEDLIEEQNMVVTISHQHYIKRCKPALYRSQRRGGQGLHGMATKDTDFVEKIFTASTHDYMLIFTNNARCYWLKVYELPEGDRTARGKDIVNLIDLQPGDSIAAVVPVRHFDDEHFVITATEQGVINRRSLMAYSNPRSKGIIATGLADGDRIIGVQISNGHSDVIITTRYGKAIRFNEQEIRETGRTSVGVRAITLSDDTTYGPDGVVAMQVVDDASKDLLSVCENGYGKRTPIAEYPQQHRGGQGRIAIKLSERNGGLVSVVACEEGEDLMIMADNGIVIRTPIEDIRSIGRNTQGVRLININNKDEEKLAKVIAVVTVDREPEEEIAEDSAEAGTDASMDEEAALNPNANGEPAAEDNEEAAE